MPMNSLLMQLLAFFPVPDRSQPVAPGPPRTRPRPRHPSTHLGGPADPTLLANDHPHRYRSGGGVGIIRRGDDVATVH